MYTDTDIEYAKFLLYHKKGKSEPEEILTLAISLIKENYKKVDNSFKKEFFDELFNFISGHIDDEELQDVFAYKLSGIGESSLIKIINALQLLLITK